MQPAPNRLGLGLRPPLPSYGQGPSISALAQQQQMMHQPFMPPQKQATLFVGSISGGITDAFLNRMLTVSASSCSDSLHVLNHARIGFSGVWSRQVIQASHHPCKQTARIRFRRIRGSRLCNQMFDPPPEYRATGARRWVRKQKASGASHHYRANRFTPTSHTFPQIKADEKTKLFLDAYSAQKMKTDVRLSLCRMFLTSLPRNR